MARARKARGATPEDGVIRDLAERRRRSGNARNCNEDAPDSPAEEPGEESKKPETREERARRIADLKERIASGNYSADAREIARKIIERGF